LGLGVLQRRAEGRLDVLAELARGGEAVVDRLLEDLVQGLLVRLLPLPLRLPGPGERLRVLGLLGCAALAQLTGAPARHDGDREAARLLRRGLLERGLLLVLVPVLVGLLLLLVPRGVLLGRVVRRVVAALVLDVPRGVEPGALLLAVGTLRAVRTLRAARAAGAASRVRAAVAAASGLPGVARRQRAVRSRARAVALQLQALLADSRRGGAHLRRARRPAHRGHLRLGRRRDQRRLDAGRREARRGGLGERDAVLGEPQRHQGLHRGLAAPGAAEAGAQPGLVDQPLLLQLDHLLVGAQLPQLHPYLEVAAHVRRWGHCIEVWYVSYAVTQRCSRPASRRGHLGRVPQEPQGHSRHQWNSATVFTRRPIQPARTYHPRTSRSEQQAPRP